MAFLQKVSYSETLGSITYLEVKQSTTVFQVKISVLNPMMSYGKKKEELIEKNHSYFNDMFMIMCNIFLFLQEALN